MEDLDILPFILFYPSSFFSPAPQRLSNFSPCIRHAKRLCFEHAFGRTPPLPKHQIMGFYQSVSTKLMECSSKKNSDYIFP